MSKWSIEIEPVVRWDFLASVQRKLNECYLTSNEVSEQQIAALVTLKELFSGNPIGREGVRTYGARLSGVPGERVSVKLYRGSVVAGENLPGRVT